MPDDMILLCPLCGSDNFTERVDKGYFHCLNCGEVGDLSSLKEYVEIEV